ncbi:glutathione-dependent formaldehyde-activating enzyme [Colletotrichum asianum]
MVSTLSISCLCGATAQQVKARGSDTGPVKLSINHSDVDRHASGVLCTSYYPIEQLDVSKGLTKHEGAEGWTRYFCSTCGCHVLRSRVGVIAVIWEAATGVINDATGNGAGGDAVFVRHTSVPDTKDGGISVWLSEIDGQTMEVLQHNGDNGSKEMLPSVPSLLSPESMPASCACGTVSFHITRPDEKSCIPHSGYPDLQYAACSHSAEFMGNAKKDKWWIRANGKKYLAGTCACRSCRLITGFEIQTWVFVPRSNIFFHVPSPDGRQVVMPLDFNALPPGILQTYSSSPGVLREFCGKCGATVFWHDKWRPDVIDISVGLFRAKEGARAETWLDWWTERCSFEEEAERGRTGEAARLARRLVDGLERGLRSGAGEN